MKPDHIKKIGVFLRGNEHPSDKAFIGVATLTAHINKQKPLPLNNLNKHTKILPTLNNPNFFPSDRFRHVHTNLNEFR